MLTISILIIIFGIGLVTWQLQDLADNKETDLLNIASRLVFIILVMFIAQTLIKLYKYNIIKADYYLSCADALRLTKKFEPELEQKFNILLSTLTSDKNFLETPDTPSIPFLTKPTS